jgi:hypothetical protein
MPRVTARRQRRLWLTSVSVRIRRRKWTAADIEFEREKAERQRKIDAGEVMRCPSCKTFAPVSEGVILSHNLTRNYGGGDREVVPCGGEGFSRREISLKQWRGR